MPSYVSHKGVWYPAKEKVALTNKSKKAFTYQGKVINPGDPFIYEGPDREALRELFAEGQETRGQDFRRDPEFIQACRNRGFNTVDDYLAFINYDEAADDKKFKEKAAQVTSHEISERVKELNFMGGGKDTSGAGKSFIGGFGEERLRPAEELK